MLRCKHWIGSAAALLCVLWPAAANDAHAQGKRLTRPPTTTKPRIPINPAAPAQFTRDHSDREFTETVACPQQKILVDIPPNYVPPGWTSSGVGLVLESADALGIFQGKQQLSCRYRANVAQSAQISTLNRFVEPGSCIVAPDARSFRCKPGAVK